MSIHFNAESISFTLKNKKQVKSWITEAISLENKNVGEINYIFCSDEYLLKLNQDFLDHDTFTDIITFDYSDEKTNPPLTSGDIFISIDRVKENAEKFNVLFPEELQRVMIHGVLHLMGYKDKKEKDKSLMRQKENFYLDLFK